MKKKIKKLFLEQCYNREIYMFSFLGMLADMTGNYVEVFYMTGVTISTAGILCLPLICLHRRNLVNKQQKEDLIDININDIESTYL